MLDYSKIQQAITFATNKFENVESPKPTLLHSLRCGIKLMNDDFDTDIIVAGMLHDVVEDTDATAEEVDQLFGGRVARIVQANTKDPKIYDKNQRREELIKRCCDSGYEALVVKISDIYDNYLYYKAINDASLVGYCLELKNYLVKHMDKKDLDNEYIDNVLSQIN